MQKKDKTKPRAKATTPDREADYQRIAGLVADIIEDPATPDGLRNALENYINELSNDTQVNDYTPEVARVALPLMFIVEDAFPGATFVRSHQLRAFLRERREGGK